MDFFKQTEEELEVKINLALEGTISYECNGIVMDVIGEDIHISAKENSIIHSLIRSISVDFAGNIMVEDELKMSIDDESFGVSFSIKLKSGKKFLIARFNIERLIDLIKSINRCCRNNKEVKIDGLVCRLDLKRKHNKL